LVTKSIAVAHSTCSIMCFGILSRRSGGLLLLEIVIKTRFWITVQSCPYDRFSFVLFLHILHHYS